MKKLLLIVGAMLMVSSAHASKARMEALQQGKMGSDFLTDTRNVFSNPAAINDLGQYLILEWGQRTAGVTTGDSQSAPKPEGGFFTKHNDIAWGLYLGNENDQVTDGRNAPGVGLLVPDNNFEVFVGSQAAVKWGASLFYGASQNDVSATINQKESLMGVRGGVVADQYEVGLTYVITDSSKGITGSADTEWKGKNEMALYGIYHLGVGDVYLGYVTGGGDYTANATTAAVTMKTSDTYVGWAKQFAVKENGFWFYSINYDMNTILDDGTIKHTYNHVPVTLGYEGKANSWLTLRGSVAQDVFMNEEKDSTVARKDLKNSRSNTTTVAAGATIGFDTTKVDFVIGDMATGTFHTGNSTAAAGNPANGMFSRVSMTYNF